MSQRPSGRAPTCFCFCFFLVLFPCDHTVSSSVHIKLHLSYPILSYRILSYDVWVMVITRRHLRPAGQGDLVVPRLRSTTGFGPRSFSVGPPLWNTLPSGTKLKKNGKMVNGSLIFIERLKASAWHQLYLPLLPMTHARSESINADSLKL